MSFSSLDTGDDLRSNPFKERGNDGQHGGTSLQDDPLQVPNGLITRLRAKKIKEAMQVLVQSTWTEFANLSSKIPTFKMGLKEEPALIHMIEATEGSA